VSEDNSEPPLIFYCFVHIMRNLIKHVGRLNKQPRDVLIGLVRFMHSECRTRAEFEQAVSRMAMFCGANGVVNVRRTSADGLGLVSVL
jgi:hypothetical protein